MDSKSISIANFNLLKQLRADYPNTPFLALGQTVFWDEPMKTVLRKMLDDEKLGGTMVIGVHDTDYFAKAHVTQEGHGRFALMAHNDGTTKSLWSAAGEISTLFGSETFPTRHDYVKHGVAFRRLADAHPNGRQAFLDEVTEAWGWRGLVYTESRDLIVNAISLHEVGDAIEEMLSWGFENALQQILPGCCREEASKVTNAILFWCREYREYHPKASLSDLYQHLIPHLFKLLLGYEPENIEITSSTSLLQFTPETASLPRFQFVDLFLNPRTADIARDAYNNVLAGGEIYTLDRFGPGALPFDCLIPGRGRGTIRVTPKALFVETRRPVALPLEKPVHSVGELAARLHQRFGDDVTLVGKAVSLISMLSQEFIFVFNEEGSLYVNRTRKMHDMLRQQGIPISAHPILRLNYSTWDSLDTGRATLCPSPHLAKVFGQQTISTPDLAAAWRERIEDQRTLCIHLGSLHKPVELLNFLEEQEPGNPWEDRKNEYLSASQKLKQLHAKTSVLRMSREQLYVQIRSLKAATLALQRQKGEHFRSVLEWTDAEIEIRRQFEIMQENLEHEKRQLCAEVSNLRARQLRMERGEEAVLARQTLSDISLMAEKARLDLVRNALLAMDALPHTNHRPSAWWIALLSPSGEWFRRIAETTRLYTEPLLS